MKKAIFLIFVFFSAKSIATTWRPAYPYTQKTENGKVKCVSFPYGGNRGPYGLGETFISFNGKLIYTIDKYFSTPFFTINNGQYLIEFNFRLDYQNPYYLIEPNGKWTLTPIKYEGNAIHIYKNGKIFKTVSFADLKIDTSKLYVNNDWDYFNWNYRANKSADELQKKMSKYPAYVEGDSLFLITADGQLLSVNIISGQIYPRNNAYDILSSKLNWTPTVFKRKIKKVKYPEDFVLPKLKTGKTIGEGLAQLLKRRIASDDKDSATIQIYVYSLLINRQGKCEYISVSPPTRSDITNYYGWKDNYEENKKLEDEIEKWIAEQTLKTNTIPKTFSKFEYHGFVYLKD